MEYCTKCGAVIPEGSKFCPKCGQPVEYEERVYEPEVTGPVRPTSRAPAPGPTSDATGAIVVGVLALVFACLFFPIGCCLGIVALAMGSSANSRGAPNAMVAIVLGVIAVILAILVFVVAFYYVSTFYPLFISSLVGSAEPWVF
jgi:hypothetical protein